MVPPINEFYQGLEGIPWIQIGDFPSDVLKLEEFGRYHGFENFYIKQDSTCHSVYAGNKIRKLEYVLADARAKNRKLLITLGAVGSNQVLATGIFGKQLGFEVTGIVMDQPVSEYVRKNLLADRYFEVDLKYTGGMLSEMSSLILNYIGAYIGGRRPYLVLPGASSSPGNLGFVNAVYELKIQVDEGLIPEPDYIICTAGSLGTASGLDLGCRLLELRTKVLAIGIAYPEIMSASLFAWMINSVNKFMRKYDESVPLLKLGKEDVTLITDYIGEGYAYCTEQGLNTIDEMSRFEGIMLDPTYTAKALGGGLDQLKKNGKNDKTILFWNTYNSIDISHYGSEINYKTLPKVFHRYFETPTQEEEWRRKKA